MSIKETAQRATKGQFTATRKRPDGKVSRRSFTFISKTLTGGIKAEMTELFPVEDTVDGPVEDTVDGPGLECRRVKVKFRKDGLKFVEVARAARGYSKWVTA